MKRSTREAHQLEMLIRMTKGEDPILDADRKTRRLDAAHTVLGSLISEGLAFNVGGRLWPTTTGLDFMGEALARLEAKAEAVRQALVDSEGKPKARGPCKHLRRTFDHMKRAYECLDCGVLEIG